MSQFFIFYMVLSNLLLVGEWHNGRLREYQQIVVVSLVVAS